MRQQPTRSAGQLSTGAVPSPATLVVRDREFYNTTKATLLGRLLGDNLSLKRVLNVGGGGGFLAVWCAERGAQVSMVAPDADALEATRVLARRRGVEEQIRFLRAEGLPAEITRQRFDLIIAKNVLEDVSDDGGLLRMLADCQAPGGRLVVSAQNRWSLNYLLEGLYHRWWCREKDWCGWHAGHRRFYTPRVLSRRLREAGYNARRWAGVFILPYNILTWLAFRRWKIVLSSLRWVDLALGDRFPFNRLGWNLLVSAERRAPVAAPAPAPARSPEQAPPRRRSIGLRRQPPVYSPLTFRAIARAAPGVISRADPRARLLESLRDRFGARSAVLTSSGTHALQVAMVAASRAADGTRRVALPAYSCYDVAAAAVGVGAEIDLYDVDPVTLAPDLDSLTATLASGTRIVVVSPLWGIPVPWEDIERCTSAFGAVAIEDAAQGHGGMWQHRELGSLGRISVLSFGRGKGWTGGAGGAVMVRGSGEVNLDWLGSPGGFGLGGEIGILARAAAQRALGHPWSYALPAMVPWLHLGETRYREPGPVASMCRSAAALLESSRSQATIEGLNRRLNAEFLMQRLPASLHLRRVRPPEDSAPGYLRLPVLLSSGFDRLSDPGRARRLGLAPGYPTTLATLPTVRRNLASAGVHCPGAEQLVRQLVTLPTHSLLTAKDRAAILDLLATYPE